MSKSPTHQVSLPAPANVDGLSDGEKVLIQTIERNSRALIEQTNIVAEYLSSIDLEIKDWKTRQNIARRAPEPPPPAPEGLRPRDDYAKPPAMTPAKKMTTCGSKNFEGCGAPIYWEDRKPRNPNGSEHRCQR